MSERGSEESTGERTWELVAAFALAEGDPESDDGGDVT
jgi:hypothetical protein